MTTFEADWIRRSQSGTLSRHYYTEVVQVQEGEKGIKLLAVCWTYGSDQVCDTA